jgi:hypothetical protein
MARRIKRQRRVTHPDPVRPVDSARPQTNLPGAMSLPVTRIVIAAPGPLRTVLTSPISGSTEIKLAGAANDGLSTVEKIVTEEADVPAIDINRGGKLGGLEIARNASKV